MFYEIKDSLREIDVKDINSDVLTVGCISSEELVKWGKDFKLSDDMNLLNSISDHIQDAYATYLDQKMNNTMKIFTVITTIFFPLTIIVGWYGMNFQNMPELAWKYGYLYVSILSALVVVLLFTIVKKKKWF